MSRIRTTIRTAVILAMMSFGPMLVANMMGMVRIDNQNVISERQAICQKLATTVSGYLSQKDNAGLNRACQTTLNQVADLRSIRIVRYDGVHLFCSSDHNKYWHLKADDVSTIDRMRIPLHRDGRAWAEIEVAFNTSPSVLYGPWLRWMLVIGIGFVLNVSSFTLFLGRSMKVGGARSVVPQRVRHTLDAIVGGVVILDAQGNILLVNKSFAACIGKTEENLVGIALADLPWRRDNEEEWPWNEVLRDKSRRASFKMHMSSPDGTEYSFIANATPVLDSRDHVNGALVSFENITVMENQRCELMRTLQALEASQAQIRMQNEVLHELASRDGLTGAYNRRAIFELVEPLWEDRNQGEHGLVTIMMDVDHFKKLNDQHGHATGDAVLKDLVRVVQDIVGTRGVVARYGGEEFCVVMEHTRVDEGMQMAERLRLGIQEKLAFPYRVTASVGVSSSVFGARSLQYQFEQTDRGLYAAKRSGRNAVRCWSEQLERDAEDAERKQSERLSLAEIEDYPISYHAVVALSAAVAHRSSEIAAHSQRVAEMSVSLGRGMMSLEELYILEIAALLHEVGVLGEPHIQKDEYATWVNSPTALAQVLNRNRIGLEIIQSSMHCQSLVGMLQHQWDGFASSVEWGASSDANPLGARILAVVNAYDALTHSGAGVDMDHATALERLRDMAGQVLDPALVKRFADLEIGWRHSGRIESASMDGRHAVILGYQMERILHSFQSHNRTVLKSRLRSMESIATTIGMAPMVRLVNELGAEVDRKALSDWDSLVPMIGDLLELGMMIQREYLRSGQVFSEAAAS